jgi:hypothetical protein
MRAVFCTPYVLVKGLQKNKIYNSKYWLLAT